MADAPRNDPQDGLHDDEAGALQVGPTDHGMVRFIIHTQGGVVELDFEPDEAADIADELLASAERARALSAPARGPGGGQGRRRR